MAKTFVNWLVSALILFGLSFLTSIPFIDISFDGSWGQGRWLTIIVVAVVLGLINALIGPILHKAIRKSSPLILLILSLIINAALIWVGQFVPGLGFSIHFITAIIAAALLSALGAGLAATNK